MVYPFLACVLLVGMHVYLGIHVLARKIIFVDLALAQVAALGAIYGVLLGYDVHDDPWVVRTFSLVFAGIGAVVLTWTRPRRDRIPQEALVGTLYAVTLAATVLGSAHLPHGAEAMRDLMSGSILWVDGNTLAWTALLYGGVGLLHGLCRKRFLALSRHSDVPVELTAADHWWDFIFYLSFALVVTSSVAIAGVLLVFAFLVIPAVIASLFASGIAGRLLLGWSLGTVVSVLGLATSYRADLPSGPTIVVLLGIALLIAGVVYSWLGSAHRRTVLVRLLAGVLLAASLIGGSYGLLSKPHEHGLSALLGSESPQERIAGIERVSRQPALWDQLDPHLEALWRDPDAAVRLALVRAAADCRRFRSLPPVETLLSDVDDELREATAECIRQSEDPCFAPALTDASRVEADPHLRVLMADTLAELGSTAGIPILIELLGEDAPIVARRNAFDALARRLPLPDSMVHDPPDAALSALLQEWWRQRQSSLRWDPGARRFISQSSR